MFLFFMRDSEMVGMRDCQFDGEVAASQGRRGYGERERGKERKEKKWRRRKEKEKKPKMRGNDWKRK